MYSETIVKLKDVNEKFKQRIAELEGLITISLSKAQDKSSLESKEKAEHQFFSHRVSPFEQEPQVAKRNALLKLMQSDCLLQQHTIKGLKNKLEANQTVKKHEELHNKIQAT